MRKDEMTVTINLKYKVRLTFWEAFKLRLAGGSYLHERIREMLEPKRKR